MNIKLLSGGGTGKKGFCGGGSAPEGEILPDLWLKFSNNSLDSSMDGHNFIWSVTPTYADAHILRGLECNHNFGANPDADLMARLGDAFFNYGNGDDFTIKFWIKFLGAVSGEAWPICKGSVNTSIAQDWGIGLNGNPLVLPGVAFKVDAGGASYGIPNLYITDQQWHEVCFKHYSTGVFKVNIDHDFVTERTSPVMNITNASNNARIVASWFSSYNFLLDEMRIYNFINNVP